MNEQTICTKVGPMLLVKANRLFTCTTEGKIIETLQNTRRAVSTEMFKEVRK